MSADLGYDGEFIVYTDDDMLVPECKTPDSAGYDVKCPRDIYVGKKLNEVSFSTEIVIDGAGIDEPFMLMLAPRSGLSTKLDIRLKNTLGIIDKDFNGPQDVPTVIIKMPFLLWLKHFVFRQPIFKKGDRIGQMVFVKILKPKPKSMPRSANKNDSRGGFGSTGIR